MFIGAFDLAASWSNEGVRGCRKFLERVFKLQDMVSEEEEYSKELETKMHQTIKKVSQDYESMKFNTAIAAMMSLVNEFYRVGSVTKKELRTLLQLLNPVAPHITEEMWEAQGFPGRIYESTWPEYDEAKCATDDVEIALQVNGKVRATLKITRNAEKDEVLAAAKEALGEKVNGTIVKEIYVPNKIVNIVVKP